MNWKKSYNHLISGVSHFPPSVVGGGIMLACAYLFDLQNANTTAFGSSNVFASRLNQIGGLAMGYMFPTTGTYIAYSIADRPGLLIGMVAGVLAANGGSSFPGAVIGDFAVGYIILGLKKLAVGISQSLEGIKTLLLFPTPGLVLTSLATLATNSVVAPVSNALTDFLSGLSGTNATLLGAVVGGMLALDLGGPINRTAYLFSVATLTAADGRTVPSVVMAFCGCSVMVIATSCVVACTLLSKKSSENLRGAKIAAYIMGLSFSVGGAIPSVADRPKKIFLSLCVGATVTGALIATFGITLSAPTGGPGTPLFVNNIPLYLLLPAAGIAVAVCMIYFFIRNEPDQEQDMKLINENPILLDMNLQSKDDIIFCTADTLENNQRLCDKQQYTDDVYSREDEISTVMGSNIAIPHALPLGVRHASLAFLRLQNPIQWDDDQAQMVFGTAARKENSGNEHLRILSNLAEKLTDLGFTNALPHSDNPDGCLQLLEECSVSWR